MRCSESTSRSVMNLLLVTASASLLSACGGYASQGPMYPSRMPSAPAPQSPATTSATETHGPVADVPPTSGTPITTPQTTTPQTAPSGSVTAAPLAPLAAPPPPPVQAQPAPAPAFPTTVPNASSSGANKPSVVAGSSYEMQGGDTLYGVSRRFGVPVKTLYDLNGFAPDQGLKIGQKVLLPEGVTDKGIEDRAKGPAPVKIAKPAPKPEPKPVPVPVSPQGPVKPATPPVTAPATTPTNPAKPAPAPVASGFPPSDELARRANGRFQWPLKGTVTGKFGPISTGLRNDGLLISAPMGTDVKAAAGGTVVYAGSDVKELGNIVLLKHADGWVTAYAHLNSLAVKTGRTIAQGQSVGTVGQSGAVKSPQLYFEVRYTPSASEAARPIDPKLVLP
ncbi:MAG: peptidoglycan DD-metalloendopeptidase family protein [Asticcacaulis sp.]